MSPASSAVPPTAADRPQDVVEVALRLAGGRECAVMVEESSAVNLRWALNGLTTNGVSSGRTVTVAVAAPVAGGTAMGAVTRRGVGLDGIAAVVEQACALAATGAAAEDAAPLPPGDAALDWEDDAEETGPSVFAGTAEQLGEVLARSRGEGRESFGFALHELSTTWLGTTSGVRYRHAQPNGTIEVTGKSHERSRSTHVSRVTGDFRDVDVGDLDAQVRTRLGWQARRVDVAPGHYDVVLPAEAVADLMVYLYWSAGARDAYEGRSVFSRAGGTRVGERLATLPLTLSSDPHADRLSCADHVVTAGSSDFASVFDNGLASPAQTWLDAGVLAALPTTRHSAALTGLPLAPAVGNLRLSAPSGTGGVEDLAAGVGRGLLVTSLWYIREVDPMTLLLTGLTRDGVYLVEGGEVTGVTTNFRFNDSPVDLLGRVSAVGETRPALSREWGEYFPRCAMPALHVTGFNMSSVSQAS